MKHANSLLRWVWIHGLSVSATFLLTAMLSDTSLHAQCVPTPGKIEGIVFYDVNNDGAQSASEQGLSGILVQLHSAEGLLTGTTLTDPQGRYSFSGLQAGSMNRLTFGTVAGYYPSRSGASGLTSVQMVRVPSCSSHLGLTSDASQCNSSTEILTTCFVQGQVTARPEEPTIVGIEYGFNSSTPARKFAAHGETGSIWGLAWKNSTKEIFSSAFVKQYAGLKSGHDAIFKTSFNGSMYATQLFVRLSDLGQAVGSLPVSDVTNCLYGESVGKIGLGGLALSPDEKHLFVINVYNNTLVRLSSVQATSATTKNYTIPVADGHAFALKYYNGLYYIGVTIPGQVCKVLTFNPSTEVFGDTGLSFSAGSPWVSTPIVGAAPSHWLTDIDFTDTGDMLIALSDRIGHMYCNALTNRLDEQKGDLMIAWKQGNSWVLEDRTVQPEFFSDDFWVTNPAYHPEVTLGSIFSMPGTGTVVAAVFDPELNSYSGGLHRYDTSTGKKVGSKELYTKQTEILFGKATGFGDIISTCGLPDVEIGNRVWADINANGLQDAAEAGLPGVTLELRDAGCQLVGTTTTGVNGEYLFHTGNVPGGIVRDAQYYITMPSAQLDSETGFLKAGGQSYRASLIVQGNDLWDNNLSAASQLCSAKGISVVTAHTQHSFDMGLVPANDCNIALSKKVVTTGEIKRTNKVIFDLSVANIGETVLSQVEITDKIPAGYTFEASDNAMWSNQAGVLKTIITKRLIPGQTESVRLILGFSPDAKLIQFTNEGRITAIKDGQGVVVSNMNTCFNDIVQAVDRDAPTVCDLALNHKIDTDKFYAVNSDIFFTTTICNQGTVPATRFSVTNYRNDGLDFDPARNPGWVLSQDLTQLTYTVTTPLAPGDCRQVPLILHITPGQTIPELVNIAEISSCACTGTTINTDFDSTPDTDKTNDKGGRPNSSTDNLFDGNGTNDEDDHDPALIRLDLVDLALSKKALTRRTGPGQQVTFELRVTNEGQVPVSQVKIVDYIPSNMVLEDAAWTLRQGIAEKILSIPGNLQPGKSIATSITMRIRPNVASPVTLFNTGEIMEMHDQLGNNISLFDIDSTPDNIMSNDASGNQSLTVLEDDISTAYVVITGEVEVNACSVCRQGNRPDNGQFEASLYFVGRSDEEWFVESSVGLFDISSSAPPAVPVTLAEGYILTKKPHFLTGYSVYELKALHLDGKGFGVRFRNQYGDLEQAELEGGECTFLVMDVQGPRSLCTESDAVFTAVVNLPTEVPLHWTINGMNADDLRSRNKLVVDGDEWYYFGNTGSYLIRVESDGCVAPYEFVVKMGEPDRRSISCINKINVTLDQNCTYRITPAMLTSSTLPATAPYIVTVKDAQGNVIPEATLTTAHAGTTVMAMLAEGCGGNTCWATVKVEDKTPPVSICRNIDLPCYQLDEYKGPFETDNCGGAVSNVLVSEKITPLFCDDEYVKYLDRIYQATDKFGNKSSLCTMRINLEKLDLAKVTFPPSFLLKKDSALVCNQFEIDEKGRPSTEVTGIPYYGQLPLYPSVDAVCNVSAWYEDTDLGYIGCTRKIMRRWTVYEFTCEPSQPRTHTQVIEIKDTLAPVIQPIASIVTTTDVPGECLAYVTLPTPSVTDVCNPNIEVDITYPGGFIDNTKKPQRIELPVGKHTVTYTAYDACGNSSAISFLVTVVDNTPPVIACKGVVVTSLNSKGESYILPRNVDDGTYDACGIAELGIARVPQSGHLDADDFDEFVDFTCEDAGKTIMVALLATDESGNTNSCMMSVMVQDKQVPQISCPANRQIPCSQVFTGMSLAQFGSASAIDACGATVTEGNPVFNLNACRVGTITRSFTATDNLSNTSCIQTINVTYTDGFNPETDIVWPLDYPVTDKCGPEDLKPENLPAQYGYPKLTQSDCGLAAAQYEDDVFNFVSGACYKIVRTWTVIDWCEMDRLGDDYQPVVYQQIIKVNNTVPPFFVGVVADRDTFFTPKGNCTEGLVELKVTGRDLCTPDHLLRWQYKIDRFNNGTYDIINSGLGNMASISMLMPVGIHRVQWTFEDQCGNVVTKDQMILVRANEKPKAESLDNVTISVVPADTDSDGVADMEESCIYAWTLNANSTSLCCDEPLRFSFSADLNDTIQCFDCFDVGFSRQVELWVHDCNGNTDFTVLTVEVQDNNDSKICENICEIFGPKAVIAGNTSICPGRNSVLTASGGTGYTWSNGSTTASITVSPSATTTYSVTVTNETNCTGTAEATVIVNARPTASIQGNNVCQGASTTLTASGGVQYAWSTGQSGSSVVVTPATTTTYTVTVTNQAGCTNTATRTITVNPLPSATISGDLSVCINESTTLTATGGATYLWNTGATTATITVAPAITTQYTVTVTSALGCSSTASRTVVVNGLTINVGITGNNRLCVGANTSLTATGGTSYVWSTSATTTTINVAPVTTTIYRVTATDANGCTGTASTTVTVNPLPQVSVTGDNVCQGAAATLTATGGGTYAWSTGQTTASFSVTPATTTTYAVTVTNAQGCTATGTRQITVNPLPSVNITGDNAICINESTTLTAGGTGIATYAWSNGATTSSINVAPAVTTTYTVTVTSAQGCSSTASRQVTVNGLTINVAVTGINTICSGTSTILTATGGTSYVWSTGNSGASLTVSPAATTTYTVTATDQNGCNGSSSRTVTVNPLPTARVDGTAVICSGQSTTLTASGGGTYLWTTGATTNTITVSPTSFTNYRVTVTNANNCTNTASLSVIVNPLPVATITGDLNICVGESTTLAATGGATYAWTTGATTATITVSPSSSQAYRVTVTSAAGCTGTAVATVTVSPPPTVSVSGDLTICVGESTTLTATSGSAYIWNTGATTQNITVSPTVNTLYTVTVTNTNGCRGTASANVLVDAGTLSCSTRNITVYLNQLGSVQIRPEDVSTSTFGLCSNIQSTVNPTTFFCNDAGVRTVTLTVTNLNNNQSLNCTAQVTVLDTIKPTLICPNNLTIRCTDYVPVPLTNYGTPFASDNCLVGLQLVETPLINLGNCNIGIITRSFEVTDFSGNKRQCAQSISVVNNDPFTVADINWPSDITVSNCIPSTAPSSLGETTVDQGTYTCADIAISFQDNFPEADPLCGGTYQRTWTVRDACQAVPGTNAGVFTFVQTITVVTQGPVINGISDTLIYVNATTCEARLDGVFHSVTGCNLTLSNTRNANPSFNVSGVYPVGFTTVTLTATEGCDGLTATKNFIVEVQDTSTFNISCIKTFPHITDDLTVTDHVNDHVTITYNCNNQQNILVSFSNSNVNDTTDTYDCTDVGTTYSVTLYFWYEGESVPFSFCASLARIEDPANFCQTPTPRVVGLVATESGEAVPHVKVDLEGSGSAPAETGMDGVYSFPEMPAGGTYNVIPARNDNPLDGVSTLDLILMQRHILGLQKIQSPYRMIAADVNRDNRISTSDILQLRKLILGIDSSFPDNTSWRMIDKAYTFQDKNDPFLGAVKESYTIDQLTNTMIIDWVGVKTGDVNGSYETRLDGKQIQPRSTNALFRIDNQPLVKGENLIPVYAAQSATLQGLQSSVQLRYATGVEITPALLDIDVRKYSFRDGVLTLSWSDTEAHDIREGDILFYLTVSTLQESPLSAVLSMNTQGIVSEYYTPSLVPASFVWTVNKTSHNVFSAHGNTPNPWDEETNIHFTLPERGNVILTVRDMTGRLLYRTEGEYAAGENTIRVLKDQLGATGMMIYDLTYGTQTVTLKMMNLR